MALLVEQFDPKTHSRDLRVRLVISNLPKEIFEPFGYLVRCEVVEDCAFVTFEDEQDAERALEECDGKEVLGGKIRVGWYKDRSSFDEEEDETYAKFSILTIQVPNWKPEVTLEV